LKSGVKYPAGARMPAGFLLKRFERASSLTKAFHQVFLSRKLIVCSLETTKGRHFERSEKYPSKIDKSKLLEKYQGKKNLLPNRTKCR
jgi:hypothetical protein